MIEQLFIASAQAQEAASATPAAPNPVMNFLPFIVIFFIFYFLMIRPQKRKMQEEEAMLKTIGKGDEIFTKSGLLGTIHGVTEKIITLEVADNVKIKVLRNQIAGKVAKLLEEKTEEKKTDKK